MKKIKVIVDRPLGSYHPQHKDLYYPINYGYIEGVMAGDGEEQDAYILGVDEPITEFAGELYAIVHRINDVEDKWIVVPEDVDYTIEDIEKTIRFQEQYFQHILLFNNHPIRPANRNDLSRISEILVFTKRDCYREIFKDDRYIFHDLQVMKVYQSYLDDFSQFRHLFIYDDGIIKGLMNISFHQDYLELKELYVDVFFQHQLIGHQLLHFFFDIAKQLHMSCLKLWVVEKNNAAIHFYCQHGFVIDNQKELISHTDQYQILMVKEL